MLSTLLKIGKWQSEGKSEWDRFLEKPKIDYEDNRGNKITNYVLPILFDLDEKQVVIDRNELLEYRDSYVTEFKAIKIKGGNNKAIYATVPSGKLIQLYKTFFGKEDDANPEIELLEAIKKFDKNKLTNNFRCLLQEIYSLKEAALEIFQYWNKNKGEHEINKIALEEKLEIHGNEKLVMIYIKVKSAKHNIQNPMPFAKINEYEQFLRAIYGIDKKSTPKEEDKIERLCYASGNKSKNAKLLSLTDRYNINKMFVTETKNYASLFSDKNYFLNYQVDETNQEKLDYASNYILNNLRVRIANIDHIIIPQFRNPEKASMDLAMTTIKTKADLVFGLKAFDELTAMVKDIEGEIDDIFWLNFIAYESDGNFFKSTELIKDVSKFHFQKIIKELSDVHWDFKKERFVDWADIMTDYDFDKKERFYSVFNFHTIYRLIPIRKDKEKKNKALDLFKAILENRNISKRIVFDYFSELMLCHYFERYNSYTNIPKSSKDYFGKSVRDSVFKYLAFFQVLKNLNLIDMEETTKQQMEESLKQYEKSIHDFFAKMQFNQNQQAMFYLGRMLNAVEYLQVKKNIKKTVINLVNFNGLDRDDIERLRNDLLNKARQHGQMGKVIFTDGKFSELFDYNNWKMPPTEALFFLLTGYSFGTNVKEAEEREKIEAEENEN